MGKLILRNKNKIKKIKNIKTLLYSIHLNEFSLDIVFLNFLKLLKGRLRYININEFNTVPLRIFDTELNKHLRMKIIL